MKSNTKKFFNEFTKLYDFKIIRNYFKNNHNWILERVQDLDNKTVLDIGCGTGELIKELKKKYPNAKFMGIDISHNMIEKAKSQNNNSDDVNFIVDDVHNMSFEDNTFDIIVNTVSFHHYSDSIRALKEIRRVLKISGTFYLLDSIKDPRIISFMPWYWDFIDSKKCYSKHLFSKDFKELFSTIVFKKVSFIKLYKFFPVVHQLCIAIK